LQRLSKQQKSEENIASVASLESIFVSLLHAVAHHPDFGMEDEDIGFSAK
jgi:predicted Zn-dependent protease with MMP-like domain